MGGTTTFLEWWGDQFLEMGVRLIFGNGDQFSLKMMMEVIMMVKTMVMIIMLMVVTNGDDENDDDVAKC